MLLSPLLIMRLFLLMDVMFYIMSPLLLLGLDVLGPRVHRKQPLYLHEVVVRSAYTLPSPDPTLWDSTGYVVVVVGILNFLSKLTSFMTKQILLKITCNTYEQTGPT
uniref:Putative ovule protein n=1 Tax=Solanum chacoense TaxID=4108 RepID=A0A0V0HCM6_SOLCH